MKRRNYTREIQAQIREGRAAVASVGPAYLVTYSPRSKTDPQPWTSGTFRYNGREVHTVATCGGWVLMGSGNERRCGLLAGHPGGHVPA